MRQVLVLTFEGINSRNFSSWQIVCTRRFLSSCALDPRVFGSSPGARTARDVELEKHPAKTVTPGYLAKDSLLVQIFSYYCCVFQYGKVGLSGPDPGLTSIHILHSIEHGWTSNQRSARFFFLSLMNVFKGVHSLQLKWLETARYLEYAIITIILL